MILPPEFLIVGTPRSGTTLVQRLASEHPECSVPPETHFFVHLFPRLLRSGFRFPLDNTALKECLELFLTLPTSAGLSLNTDELMNEYPAAGQRPLALFGAIVRHLAERVQHVGEKTPDHLLWWRPIAHVDDRLRIVWVIRDPRGVVASALKVPWGMKSPGLLAERWRLDIKALYRAQRVLGPERLFVVRFEDIVRDTETERSAIWRFLELPTQVSPREIDESRLLNPREGWKLLVGGPISARRIDAWQEELPKESARLVVSICQRDMVKLGFEPGTTKGSRRTQDTAARLKSSYLRVNRFRRQAWINRQHL